IHDFSRADEVLDMKLVRERNDGLIDRMAHLENYQILGVSRLGSTPVITVARKLHSSTTYLYEGLLILDLNLQQIEKICKNVSLGGIQVWISTSDGTIAYHPDSAMMGARIPYALPDRDKADESSSFLRVD